MKLDPGTPVIVGAGQVLHRDAPGEQPREPVALMVEALRLAADDSGAGDRLLRRADSVRCVPAIGWRYADAAALVAEDLGLRPRATVQSGLVGGDGPQRLVNETAAAIANGELDVALLAGGDALASVHAAGLAELKLDWRRQDGAAPAARTLDAERPGVNEAEAAVGLMPPVFCYALIESAVRARAQARAEEHLERIASLWSRFSAVAAANPHAWLQQSLTAEQIAQPSAQNRLISSPYTKLLTANIRVNMATGLILASAQAAHDAGVPEERFVFVHAGAQAQDEWHVSERAELASSPAINAAAASALRHAGRAIDEIAHIDLYSCFPSAVEVAARELGLAIDEPGRPLTVTGGLTFAGGPGNNYASHSIATLVGLLRADADAYGLATALGWYVTKHAVGVYSARPPRAPFASLHPEVRRPPARDVASGYHGSATLEAYTVTYAAGGEPEAAIISALTPAGARTLVRDDDRGLMDGLLAEEELGRAVEIGADGRVTLSS